MTAEEIWSKLKEIGGAKFNHVTISGGNPALHKGIASLLELLKENGVKSAIETQGSVWQDWARTCIWCAHYQIGRASCRERV